MTHTRTTSSSAAGARGITVTFNMEGAQGNETMRAGIGNETMVDAEGAGTANEDEQNYNLDDDMEEYENLANYFEEIDPYLDIAYRKIFST